MNNHNENTRTPANSTTVGVRVWYEVYWRKMAVMVACPHPTLSKGGYKTRSEQMTYLAAGTRAGVALAGAAVAGARRHDEYRCGR
ncbi:hypothetical protein N7447_007992 [Penicillium robsamsonii]|uniref:uncharacterized protein n=1 Tax=Penicillium robsamsonii TaxID=1792511 RepID=UPI002548FD80|nr:uncharacterized protein N7447_007992 [Penicillium robsamsonii]KAJ5817984.1 hypothetical protein N7447_007992 [Penicillium robsamsonii]